MQSGPTPTREEFLSTIASLPQCVDMSGKVVELDARGFIEHIGLSGTVYRHSDYTALRVAYRMPGTAIVFYSQP